MTHSKKHVSWRCGIFDICLGFLIIFYPLILLNSFLCAFLFIFSLSTVSSVNTISMSKRNSAFSLFATHISSYDDSRNEKMYSRKTEKKEFSLLKSFIAVLCTVLSYHTICILFGAPIVELFTSTLYFSCLMTILTAYPLLWFFYSCDSLLTVVKLFSDAKCDNYVESHFYSFAIYSVIGAWVGAFPIPLDWDRPWQEWPITCCIGASLGYAAAHFFVGGKLLYSLFKEKKKLMRSV